MPFGKPFPFFCFFFFAQRTRTLTEFNIAQNPMSNEESSPRHQAVDRLKNTASLTFPTDYMALKMLQIMINPAGLAPEIGDECTEHNGNKVGVVKFMDRFYDEIKRLPENRPPSSIIVSFPIETPVPKNQHLHRLFKDVKECVMSIVDIIEAMPQGDIPLPDMLLGDLRALLIEEDSENNTEVWETEIQKLRKKLDGVSADRKSEATKPDRPQKKAEKAKPQTEAFAKLIRKTPSIAKVRKPYTKQ